MDKIYRIPTEKFFFLLLLLFRKNLTMKIQLWQASISLIV